MAVDTQAEIRQLQEQLAVEKDVWQENYRKKQDAELLARERELQQRVKDARDAEIERVMQQLLHDNQQAIDDCERDADKRIKCVREANKRCIFQELPEPNNACLVGA